MTNKNTERGGIYLKKISLKIPLNYLHGFYYIHYQILLFISRNYFHGS